MPGAYIVECVRTAGGRRKGRLSKWHPVDLGAQVVNAIIERTRINPAEIDDVIVGCVSQVGAQAGNIGRNIVLASKLPLSVPGTSVDRQCGSSQQAIHFAAQAVMSGTQDVVIAAGVEAMTQVPIGSCVIDGIQAGHGQPGESKGIQDKWPGIQFSQFVGAELLAKKYDISREEMDHFGVDSHAKAVHATQNGYFRREIVPLKGQDRKTGNPVLVENDEGIRPGTTYERLAKLKALNPDGGRLTAGTASQITDGAAAILICNEAGLKKLGLRPRAKIVALALAGSDPVIMLEGPIPATENVLKRAKMSIDDMDIYEVNEAFASVPMAWAKALGADYKKLNVNGGAIALGHPLGGTGAKLMTTMVHELERRGARYGLQAICEGGGTANATIIERIDPSSWRLLSNL